MCYRLKQYASSPNSCKGKGRHSSSMLHPLQNNAFQGTAGGTKTQEFNMKKVLLSLVAITLATISYAQSTQVATLNHGGAISTFYGPEALVDAVSHASSSGGDVITLSSGLFTAAQINKAVTIRGAGMEMDATTGIAPTIINQDFKLRHDYSTGYRLTIEGVRFNGVITTTTGIPSPTFIKCKFKAITTSDSYYHSMPNANFIHCIITDSIFAARESSFSFHNCFVNKMVGGSSRVCNFENCIIGNMTADVPLAIKNSIIFGDQIVGTCAAYNSIVFYDAVAKHCQGTDIVNSALLSNVFKEFRGTYDDNISLTLTDEAASILIGSDFTQVGIYGGAYPFDPIPTNPRIVRCDVAKRSTADGKLNVEVEVKKAE